MENLVELLETPWRMKLLRRVRQVQSELIICAPYFSEKVITQILNNCKDKVKVRFLLGFTQRSLKEGQSELNALLKIIKGYPKIEAKQIMNLHAKVYIFDGKSAIVTSSNPTANGLVENIEFGVCLDGPLAFELREKVMAYWMHPNATVLDSKWLKQHRRLLEEIASAPKSKEVSDVESRIGKYINPKGVDERDKGEWALLWSTHAGDHITKHIAQIKEQGATLWGADFAIKPEKFTFPVTGYLYVTRYRGERMKLEEVGKVMFKASIVNVETYPEKSKPKEVSLRPADYKSEYHKTYLKLTELTAIKSSVDVTSFKKHNGKNVSRYGLQSYVRVFDPHLS
ncbi:MAG: phospholipase D-like domain-containing protein [Candidatus Bathyarchaeia archaeon]